VTFRAAQFDWDFNTKVGRTSLSRLGTDTPPTQLWILNPKSGRKVVFNKSGAEKKRSGEVEYWTYRGYSGRVLDWNVWVYQSQ
jgi:hypothetical protein